MTADQIWPRSGLKGMLLQVLWKLVKWRRETQSTLLVGEEAQVQHLSFQTKKDVQERLSPSLLRKQT